MGSLKCSYHENMGRERVASTQSHNKKSFLFNVQILIVDDDATSLSLVSSMLKTCSQQDRPIELTVTTVKDSLGALSILRTEYNAVDLVITNLHMPSISGLELLKQIDEEFKIPVIIMSADDKESVVLKSLESGAVFHMVKPVSQQDIENVWQYTVAAKKGKAVAVEEEGAEMGNNDHEASSSSSEKSSCEDANSASSSAVVDHEEGNDDKKKKGSWKKRARNSQDEDAPSAPKKAKVVWTTSLHNRFLQAISHIGLEKAVPKRILEFMNVPGLTRENVASHLQKYRMFLKKVADRGFWSSQTQSERALRSSFASGYTSMLFKNAHQEFQPLPGLEHLRPTFQPGYGGNFYGLGISNFGSGNNFMPQFRFGPSTSYGYPSSFQQRPMLGSATAPLYQPNSTTNVTGFNMPANGAATYGVMNNVLNGLNNSATPMQMYQQQDQATSAPLHYFQFGSTGAASSNYASGIGNMGNFNNSYPSSLNPNNNYAGMRLTSNGELIGSGQVRLHGNDLSSPSLNGSYFGSAPMNWNLDNNNLNNAQSMNGIFGYMSPQGGSSSAGFNNYLAQGASSSSGFGTASPFPFSPFVANQENASVLPSLSQQHTSASIGNIGGENESTFNLLNDASTFNDISNNQPGLTEGELELLFGSTNITTPYQAQGVEGIVNTNFASSSNHAEAYSSVNELLNAEFSISCTISDVKTPTGEESSGQLEGRENSVVNSFGGNVNPLDEDYYPSSEQCLDNNNREPIETQLVDSAESEDQDWGDDFLDFLIGNGPI